MAQIPISLLPITTSLDGDELLVIVQDGETKTATRDNVTKSQIAVISTPHVTTSNTLVDVTALVIPVQANSVYEINCFVIFQSNSVTNGLQLGLTLPPNSLNMTEINITPDGFGLMQSSVSATGVVAANTNYGAKISGFVTTDTVAGNCQIMFASEVGGAATTLQAGSRLLLKKVA